MPLLKGNTSNIISENIAELRRAGHAEDQATAIAYRNAGEGSDDKKKKPKETDLERQAREAKEAAEASRAPVTTETPKPDLSPKMTDPFANLKKPEAAEPEAPSLGAAAKAAGVIGKSADEIAAMPGGPAASARRVKSADHVDAENHYADHEGKRLYYNKATKDYSYAPEHDTDDETTHPNE